MALFIGERASRSLLLVDGKERICGLCSEGLMGFQSYSTMSPQTKVSTIGLMSILFYTYVLMEDDLHVENFGVSELKKSGGSEKLHVYSKIDHDYIVAHWPSMQTKDHSLFSNQKYKQEHALFKRFFNTKGLSAFNVLKSLLNNARFSPLRSNPLALRLFIKLVMFWE